MKKYMGNLPTIVDDPQFPFPIEQTLVFAKENDLNLIESQILSANELMVMLSELTRITPTEICSAFRYAKLVECRTCFYYFLVTRSTINFTSMAALTGGRDHTSVMHGMKIHESLLISNTGKTGIAYQELVRGIRNKFINVFITDRGKETIRQLIEQEKTLFGDSNALLQEKNVLGVPEKVVRKILNDYNLFFGEKSPEDVDRYITIKSS